MILYIAWLVFVFFFTEFLSYVNAITKENIILGNLIFFTIFIYIFRRKFTRFRLPLIFKNKLNLVFIFLPASIFIQGFFSAPSTTDAMTYQILRTMYWLQEHTVHQDFIRNTHDFMPPFASYIFIHLYAIFNGDRFLFLSQWLAYVGSIVLASNIAKQLGADERVSQITSLFVATVPIAVLQASSTQADMVSAFLTLLLLHQVLRILKKPTYKNAIFLGVILGLGMLVKAPFYVFSIVPLSLLLVLLLKNPKKALVIGIIVLGIAFSMNFRYYLQNTRLFGNPSGQKFVDSKNHYVNERFDSSAVFSNMIRNTMNNIPVPFFTKQTQSALVVLHNAMGIDIADPKTTYSGLEFRVRSILYPQEDLAASPLHMFLILFAGFFIFRKSFKHRKKNELRVLYVFLIISYILFALILKYESVHNRLLVAFLFLGAIISAVILSGYQFGKNVIRFFIFLSVPLVFLLILLNVQHPYISYKFFYNNVKSFAGSYQILPEAFYEKPRGKQYFNSRPYWYGSYDKVTDLIAKEDKHQIITLELMDDEFEYPLWVLLKRKGVNFYVYQNKFIKRKIDPESLLLTTSEKPTVRKGFQTKCFKTDIEYGYACLSKIGAF